MSSNEMFSDESACESAAANNERRRSRVTRRRNGRRLGLTGLGRLGFAVTVVIGTFIGVTAEGIITALPAFAAQAISCTAPASGGTATTFHAGVSSFYPVSCREQTGISGTSAYPTISVNTSNVPADGNPTLATGAGCTTSTSGSGTTELYIETCNYSDTPTAADESGTAYTATFTATPAPFAGSTLTPITSGTLSVTINAPTVTCIAPASGGTSTTFYEGSTNSYLVECEEQSGISADTAYPSSIAINSGSLPADGNPSFATSTSSSPACTTGTSGSGATEQYILECALSDTPTSSDGGSYPFTFTATGAGGVGTVTSGTLTVTISPPTTTCSTPAPGGTSVSWVDGTAETETLICYSQGFATANAGNYPASITLNSGSLPSDATEATSLSSSPPCTTATSGSGTSEQYQLKCNITETPVTADNGTYQATFLATGGANGAPNSVSGTLTITISQPPPSWETSSTHDGNYLSAMKGVPFCFDLAVTTSTSGGASVGSPYSLPLTSLTAGTTPSGVTNYSIRNVNLAAGTAQLCGTNNNNAASAPVTMAPVATNSGGSATDSIPLWSQNECTWTTTSGTVSMFDPNQDLEQAGSQSAFGQPITGGVTGGTSKNFPTCTGGVGVSASGGLGDAWTINTANPLPTPTDTNPSAAQGDLPSSNLDLTGASSGQVGGCWGATNILASTSTTAFGSSGSASMTLPSSWVNGGNCPYGSLGSNSAGGNTDTPALNGPTHDAACPPNQADVNAGYVSCGLIVSSGNDENGSTNYSTLDLFYNGQPVPQQSTAALSASSALTGATVNVTGGTNWWGSPGGAPNAGPYGDFQNSSYEFYPVSAPGVYIGTSRATAVPVVNSTVAIPANTYACTGAESNTVGPNPCTLTAGQPTGSFQIPSGLTPGQYNLYIDESNTQPLPGNGPNDSYQTAQGTNLGTAESVTPITVSNSSTVTTPISSTIVFGNSNTDNATVTAGGVADPTGSVAFYECGSTAIPQPCTSASWTQFDTESLDGISNPSNVTSASFTPTSTGYWCFAGVYSGDSNYVSSSDSTIDECFHVTAAATTTVTSPANSSIVLGNSNTDGATVASGASGVAYPTGSVTFYECGSTATAQPCTSASWTQFDSESLNGTSNPSSVTSASFTPTSTGYWCFAGVYSGDSNYSGSSDQTVDECFDVTPAGSTTSTSPANSSIVLGNGNVDNALVTGAANGVDDPTGSVTFYECGSTATPEPCTSASWTQFDSESLSGSTNPSSVSSASFTPTSTGYWCFAGVYSGDSNYSGSSDQTVDECFNVTAAATTTVTTPGNPSLVLGDSNTDGATVSSVASGVDYPTGSVTFYECGSTATAQPCTSASWTQFDTESLNGTSNPSSVTSASFTPTSTGYWCFAGVYSGDSNYSGSSDETTDECFHVAASAAGTVTTPVHSSIVLGNNNKDGAVVTGNAAGGSPTGTVTFYECGPTATAQPCTSQANEVGFPVGLTAGIHHTSSANSVSFAATSTGYWCFAGVYSGDTNYSGSSDTSTDECFDVTAASSSTSSSPASEIVGVGIPNSDNASVAGNSPGGAPSGTVSFYECGPTPTATPCTSLANPVGSAVGLTPGAGDVSFASSTSVTFASVGYYCFAAYYSGDSNYNSSSDTSVTECFDVVNPPTITSFSPTSGPPGTTVTIKGTNLSGATKVTFDGVAAAITSDSATKIKATVPAGAHTGKIKVKTPGGSATSATSFTVT